MGDTNQTYYDAEGNVTLQLDGLNLATTYAYDQEDRLTLVTHPAGDTEATGYDAVGNVTSVTDGNNHTTTYMYDLDGRETTVIDALGGRTTTTYDQAGNVIQVTDALNHSTQYLFDAYGQQTAVVNALGAVTTTMYDDDGNVSVVTDPLLHTVSYAYDSLDRETSTKDRDGNITGTRYDASSRVSQSISARSGTESTAYVITPWRYEDNVSTDAMGYVFDNGYLGNGDYFASSNPLVLPGQPSYGQEDADNRLTFSADEHERATYTHYDADSRVTSKQVDDLWATYTYDNDGRVLTEKGPLVDGASFSYDAAGNVTAEANELGEVTTYMYDALNRVTVEQEPLGHVITTAYDAVGNTLSVEDSDGNFTTYAYDPINQLTSSTENGHVTHYAYDLGGNRTSTTDPDNRTIRSSFDGNGNEIGETWLASDGVTVQDTVTYQYDADGNLTVAGDNAGTYTMSYDLDDRLTFEQEPFGATVSYGYDGMGDITLQQDNFGGVMTLTYDPDQELNVLQFSQGGSTPEQLGSEFDYNEDGTITQLRRYSDAALTHQISGEGFGYSAGRLTGEASFDLPGGTLATEDLYTYQSDGGADDGQDQMISRFDYAQSTTTFAYDATGQLTGSQNSVYGNLTFSYDAAGNSAAAGTTIGADNEIQTDGTWNYSYDADGNRTMKINIAGGDAWTYAYDDQNRLITVKHFSSSSGGVPTGTLLLQEDFTYDVFGNRLSDTLTQSGTTTVTRFAYDQNGNAWADLNSSNQLVTRRIYLDGVDQLFARIDASTGAGYFYITDSQGTVRDLLDVASQTIVDRIDYDAWGNVLNETAPSYGDRYKYTGREWDAAIDLQYSRARWYDPSTRNFISPDPAQADPLGNTYRYVDNDPMDGTDPSGTQERGPSNQASAPAMDEPPRVRTAFEIGMANPNYTPAQIQFIQHADRNERASRMYDRQYVDNLPGQAEMARQSDQAALVKAWKGYLQTVRATETSRFYTVVDGAGRTIESTAIAVDPITTPMFVLLHLGAGQSERASELAIEGATAYVLGVAGEKVFVLLGKGWTRFFGPTREATEEAAKLVNKEIANGLSKGGTRTAEELAERLAVITNNSCFVAGTPLLTPTGSKPVEQFVVGDLILSRPENEPEGTVTARHVEEVFVREARIIRLRISSRLIETTREHPFFVIGRGWCCGAHLRKGDILASHNGIRGVIEGVEEPGLTAKVYNLRVSEYHTYFVGSSEWGFSVWAHNAEYVIVASNGGFHLVEVAANGSGKVVTEFGAARTRIFRTRQEALEAVESGGGKLFGAPKASAKPPEDFKYGEYLKSLEKDALGKSHPGPTIVGQTTHAHHIVMQEGLGAEAKVAADEARQILAGVGLDPYQGVQNLVWAPNSGYLRSTEYAQQVLKRLKPLAGDETKVVQELKNIAEIVSIGKKLPVLP